MPIFIDRATGFPSEVPCPSCGWPLYCCLCEETDDDPAPESQPEQTPEPPTLPRIYIQGKKVLKTVPTLKELIDAGYMQLNTRE